MAVAAQRERLADLDDLVGATFESWREGLRASVTLRHLLSLSAGLAFGGLGRAVPTYEKALQARVLAVPGSRFTYGGVSLQVFGAVLARKLQPIGMTPHEYLRARVLDPAGVRVDGWRKLADGTHPLPTGASLSTRNWAAYGAFVLERFGELSVCFTRSAANPRYGLGWWLWPLAAGPDVVYAGGSGGQGLYVLPAQRTLVVRFGRSRNYDHVTFLRRLLCA